MDIKAEIEKLQKQIAALENEKGAQEKAAAKRSADHAKELGRALEAFDVAVMMLLSEFPVLWNHETIVANKARVACLILAGRQGDKI